MWLKQLKEAVCLCRSWHQVCWWPKGSQSSRAVSSGATDIFLSAASGFPDDEIEQLLQPLLPAPPMPTQVPATSLSIPPMPVSSTLHSDGNLSASTYTTDILSPSFLPVPRERIITKEEYRDILEEYGYPGPMARTNVKYINTNNLEVQSGIEILSRIQWRT